MDRYHPMNIYYCVYGLLHIETIPAFEDVDWESKKREYRIDRVVAASDEHAALDLVVIDFLDLHFGSAPEIVIHVNEEEITVDELSVFDDRVRIIQERELRAMGEAVAPTMFDILSEEEG